MSVIAHVHVYIYVYCIQDIVNKQCVTLQSLEKDSVRAAVSEVVLDPRGDCQYRDLEQETQVKLLNSNQYY